MPAPSQKAREYTRGSTYHGLPDFLDEYTLELREAVMRALNYAEDENVGGPPLLELEKILASYSPEEEKG